MGCDTCRTRDYVGLCDFADGYTDIVEGSLLERLAQGEKIIITRYGKPLARLAPVEVAAIGRNENIIEAHYDEFRNSWNAHFKS
jgi:hypothetical protein